MAKFTKRKDGRFTTTITLNGKRKYLYANTEKELDLKLAEQKINKARGTININDNITFRKYAENWFKINCTTLEPATQSSIKTRLNHLYEYFGEVKIKNLKQYHIQNMVTSMIKAGYTDATKRTLGECKRILKDAQINDVVFKNVAIGVKVQKFPKAERKPLTLSEDKKLLKFCPNHKYGLFILVLRYCGLRPEEIVPLVLEDIDLNKKTISINKAVTFIKNQPVVKSTKNKKNRKLPIPDVLLEPLTNRVNFCKKNNIKYIFTKETNNQSMLSKTALRRHLETFLNNLNKELPEKEKMHFSYYILRHSYCTMLYYAGIKIKKAQMLMGHSSADMVYDIYTHLDEERENAEILIDNYISKELID